MQIYRYSSLFKVLKLVLKLVLKSKKQKNTLFTLILFVFIIFTPIFRGTQVLKLKLKIKTFCINFTSFF